MQAGAVNLANEYSASIRKSNFLPVCSGNNCMAFSSQHSFSNFPAFCTLAISTIMFGTVIITVPAVLLAVGDPNAALLGVS